MNQNDRQLIAELFERMRSVDRVDKDQDAEAFIHQSMRENADSPYLLVQSVLAQEVALQEAGQRIEELEAQITQNPTAGFTGAGKRVPAGQPAPWEAGGDQSGASGRSSPANVWGAPVNRSGDKTNIPPVINDREEVERRASPSVPASGRGAGPTQGGEKRDAGSGRRSGFMQQAMSTAAGVAGGMLLANSIGSLFGGGSSSSTESGPTTGTETASATDTAATDSSADSTADKTPADEDQAADQQSSSDSGVQEAAHDDEDIGGDGDWGGDDWGLGDFEL